MPELTDKTLKKLSPKDTVEHVFEDMGGVPKMVEWAKSNPTTFYVNLYGKLIAQPLDLNLQGRIVIDLPWLTSRPGREPVTLTQEGDQVPNPGQLKDLNEPPARADQSVQVPASETLHTDAQPDPAVRVHRVPQKKWQNSRARK